MKKIMIYGFLFSLLSAFTNVCQAQNGLENIIVEKYYVSNAADSIGSTGTLPVGSVTYRVYADMLPGYKFQALYGVSNHTLLINSSTTFFNNEDYGATSPQGISVNNTKKNTVMLDSWFSVGGTAVGKSGVLKSEDTDGSIGNSNGLLTNNDPSTGIQILVQDGMAAVAPESPTFVGLNNTGNGDLGVFDGVSLVGGLFSTSNGSIASLNGSSGPTATNRVLIGQFTTNGVFHFELNIQIGTPTGGTQNYVASSPVGSEITIPSLTGTFGAPNALPTVAITSPSNGASFITGTVIPLTATASDADGTVTQVEFFVDGVSVGVDATAPYTSSYTGVIGSHTIAAKATDDQGAVSTATISITVASNPAPTCVITNPTNGSSVINGDVVSITANATDNVSVASVEFFVDGVSLGLDNTAPYSINWTAVLGAHSITARATDNLGAQTISSAVGVTCVNNVPPSCSITAPSNGALYTAPAVVAIAANAADVDGTIASVDFYVNGTLVGSDATAPYSFNWTSVIGSAVLTVKATDNRGAVTTSSAVTISVADPNALPYNVSTINESCNQAGFCLPVIAHDTVQNVIGYDVVLHYNSLKLKPTGSITVASDLINPSYVDAINSIDSVNGNMYISLFFNASAPANAKFTGAGTVFCVGFTKTALFTSVDTSAVTIPSLQESYYNGVTAKLVQAGNYISHRDSVFTGKLSFWADNSPIKYNAANPNQYLPTNINGNDASCSTPSSVVVNPDTTGSFSHVISNGLNLNINKDIPGTTDVQPVINGFDALLARKVLLNDVSFIPNVYNIISMDVNEDGVISAGDVSQINQRAVLMIPEFRQAWNYNANGVSNGQLSKDWIFVDTARVATDVAFAISTTYPNNDGIGFSKYKVPVLSFCMPVPATNITDCPVISAMTYKGILIGDINGNYATTSPNNAFRSSSSDKVVMDMSKAVVENGYLTVPVFVESVDAVNSLDFAMMYNQSSLHFNSVVDNTNSLQALANVNADDKVLRFTSNSLQNYDLSKAPVSVRFAIGQGEVSASDFNALAAYVNGERVSFELASAKLSGTGSIINIYPNPATDMLNVEVSENATLQLMDVEGRQVIAQTEALAGETASFSTQTLANGVYVVRVLNGSSVSVKRVVVSK